MEIQIDIAEFEREIEALNNEPTPGPNAALTSANIQVSAVSDHEYNNEVQEVEWNSLKAAEHYYASGLCPMPCNMYKSPLIVEWGEFCHANYATSQDLVIQEDNLKHAAWFGSRPDTKQVGICLGRASGGLEVIDIESESAYIELISSTQGTGVGDLIERCPMSRSVNGGAHIFLFHAEDYPVEPGEVLAKAATTVEGHKSQTLIEALGEGKQVVVPTNPVAPDTCKQPYMKGKRIWIRSLPKRFEDRVIVSREQGEALRAACRKLSEVELDSPKVELGTCSRTARESSSSNSVFIQFNCSQNNQELALNLLYEAGWTLDHTSGGITYLTRAGKTDGTSATWGGCTNTEHGYPYFHVFTSGAGSWEQDKNYSPWDIVQKLKYDDDRDKMLAVMNAASLRELAAKTENNPEYAYQDEKAEATNALTKVASEKEINKFKSKVAKFKFPDKNVGSADGGMSKIVRMGKQDYALSWEQANSIIVNWNTKTESNWPIDVIKDLWTITQVDAEQYGSALEKVPTLELDIEPLSDLDIQPVNWIIQDSKGKGFLPAGLSMIVGQSGLGKSTFTRYLAACVTNGGGGSFIVDSGEVLFLCYEDNPEETILPHVICCGGDPSKIFRVKGLKDSDGKELAWNASHMAEVKKCLQQKPNIKLVVIDVLTSLTSGTKASTNDADQTRAILEPLNKMGQELGVAMLVLHHPNKHGTTARSSISGSTQLVAVCRMVFTLGEDPDDPDNIRQLSRTKRNYNPETTCAGIAFKHKQVPREVAAGMAIKFGKLIPAGIQDSELNTVEIIDKEVSNPDDLVKGPRSSLDQCVTWLSARLGTVEQELSTVLQQECLQAGHTIATFKRAKATLEPLGLQTFKVADKWYMKFAPTLVF